MYTSLDNQERTFLIKSESLEGQIINTFCNLKSFPRVLSYYHMHHNTIYHYWNNKLRKCSKKYLNEMLKANKIEFKIN